jgi:alcohol dehydrogenase class IV
MDHGMNYLEQIPEKNDIPLAAVPTTAGTGSESTRYAVIYYKGEKQSVTHDSIIPSYALLIPDVLDTLPAYQKKCTMLDAFSQAVESYWSVNSTEESRSYSKTALELMVPVMSEYAKSGGNDANSKIMGASNYSGRAINISQTTAVHAMSYKITSIFGLPHGHAVAICLPHVWEHMIHNTDNCLDPRGSGHLRDTMNNIARSTGSPSPIEAVNRLKALLRELEIFPPAGITSRQMETLVGSVNETRLKNHPVKLDRDQIRLLYEKIFITEENDYGKM